VGSGRDDEVDLAVDELGRDLGGALGAGLRPAIFDRDGAALDPAKFVQSLNKSSGPWTPGRSVRAQDPNSRQLCRLLPARRERPCPRADEQRDELTSFQVIELHLLRLVRGAA
jgi:hypothetical protein